MPLPRKYIHQFSPVFSKMPIYISPESCIMNPEQSRRRRVKCHRDGEFARRTKERSTMLSPHPLLHIGITSFM